MFGPARAMSRSQKILYYILLYITVTEILAFARGVHLQQILTNFCDPVQMRYHQIGKHESLEGKTSHLSTLNIFVELVV